MGILRRAEKRGKELPPMLKEALEEVVGGSVQCLNPWDCESKRQYEVGGVYRTLDAGNGAGGQAHGVCYSPAAFMGGQGAKAGSIAYADDGSTPTIKSAPSGGNTVPDVVYPINTMVATRGGKDDMRTCFGIGEPNDPQFTLSSAHEHGVCYAIEGNGTRESHRGNGYAETDTMYTLNTSEMHKVAYAIEGNVVDRDAKQNGMGVSEDTSPSLNTQDKHAVAYGVDCRNLVMNEEKSATIQAKNEGGHSMNFINPVCYRQDGFADYREGVGTLKASGGDMGGGSESILVQNLRRQGERGRKYNAESN